LHANIGLGLNSEFRSLSYLQEVTLYAMMQCNCGWLQTQTIQHVTLESHAL